MINTDKLQGKMREKKYSIKKLAQVTNLSKTGLFNKIHGKVEFVCSEMQAIKKALNLSDVEFEAIFFAQNVE